MLHNHDDDYCSHLPKYSRTQTCLSLSLDVRSGGFQISRNLFNSLTRVKIWQSVYNPGNWVTRFCQSRWSSFGFSFSLVSIDSVSHNLSGSTVCDCLEVWVHENERVWGWGWVYEWVCGWNCLLRDILFFNFLVLTKYDLTKRLLNLFFSVKLPIKWSIWS